MVISVRPAGIVLCHQWSGRDKHGLADFLNTSQLEVACRSSTHRDISVSNAIGFIISWPVYHHHLLLSRTLKSVTDTKVPSWIFHSWSDSAKEICRSQFITRTISRRQIMVDSPHNVSEAQERPCTSPAARRSCQDRCCSRQSRSETAYGPSP